MREGKESASAHMSSEGKECLARALRALSLTADCGYMWFRFAPWVNMQYDLNK